MTQIPPEPLVPGNTLITASPEAGRALAILLARHSIHAMQKELELLKEGRAHYARDADGPHRGGPRDCGRIRHHRRANNYWRNQGAAAA